MRVQRAPGQGNPRLAAYLKALSPAEQRAFVDGLIVAHFGVVPSADRARSDDGWSIQTQSPCACGCGQPVLWSGRGRPKVYATSACVTRAARRRARERKDAA